MHRDGHLEQAEEAYKAVLSRDLNVSEAHHMLGALILMRHGAREVRTGRLAGMSM
jgi:hypothetical protein